MLVNINGDVPFPSFRSEILSSIYVVKTETTIDDATEERSHCAGVLDIGTKLEHLALSLAYREDGDMCYQENASLGRSNFFLSEFTSSRKSIRKDYFKQLFLSFLAILWMKPR